MQKLTFVYVYYFQTQCKDEKKTNQCSVRTSQSSKDNLKVCYGRGLTSEFSPQCKSSKLTEGGQTLR